MNGGSPWSRRCKASGARDSPDETTSIPAILVGPIDVERSSVMIPATLSVEKVFQFFRTFPMGGEQRRSGRIPLTEHEREVVRVPIRSSGGVGDKQVGLRGGAKVCQVGIGEVAVFTHVQPVPGMGQRGMGGITPNLQQLLLRGQYERDRSVFHDQLLNESVP